MGLFKKEEEELYTESESGVRYLDGSALNRPMSLPKKNLFVAGLIVLVALAAGGLFVSKTIDTVIHGPQRAQEQLEANLARQVSYDIPAISSLMALDDAAIRQSFVDSGLTMHDLSKPEDNPAGGFDSVKLPEGMTVEEAASYYSTGVGKLDSADAARLLNGSWTINVNRKDYVDIRIRYCDFTSESIDAAIQKAMQEQGLDESILGEFGEDNAGNTFQSGVVEVGDVMYSWRISACSLSAVYDFYGFPENGVYIGIRITE